MPNNNTPRFMCDRLRAYVAYKELTLHQFERNCGLSVGYISHLSTDISITKLMLIEERYPELNPKWIVTGEGEMLRTPIGDGIFTSGRKVDILAHLPKEFTDMMSEKDRQLAARDAHIAEQDRHIAAIDSLLADKDRQLAARDEQIDNLIKRVAAGQEQLRQIIEAFKA